MKKKVDFSKFPCVCTLVYKANAGATEREDTERPESAADQAQVFPGG